MKAYSIDLRTKIVESVKKDSSTSCKVAQFPRRQPLKLSDKSKRVLLWSLMSA
jgi:hypothetical protein